MSARVRFSLPLLALLAACGPAPVPVDKSTGASRTNAAPPSAGPLPDASGELPEGHPPLDSHQLAGGDPTADVRFAGLLRLKGSLATREDGCIMISVKPAGIRMPSFSKRYELTDAEPLTDGERKLYFELDKSDMMGGLVPGDLVLEARYDGDCAVESREDAVIETVETAVGDTSAEITLES